MRFKTAKTREDVIKIIQQNQANLAELKVKRLGIFGSFARGDQTAKSDVDLLVEFSDSVGYFHFFEVQSFLAKILGRNVDLATKRALRPEYQEEVEKELIRAA